MGQSLRGGVLTKKRRHSGVTVWVFPEALHVHLDRFVRESYPEALLALFQPCLPRDAVDHLTNPQHRPLLP